MEKISFDCGTRILCFTLWTPRQSVWSYFLYSSITIYSEVQRSFSVLKYSHFYALYSYRNKTYSDKCKIWGFSGGEESKMMFFRDLAACRHVDRYYSFGETNCLHLQEAFKMEIVCFSEICHLHTSIYDVKTQTATAYSEVFANN